MLEISHISIRIKKITDLEIQIYRSIGYCSSIQLYAKGQQPREYISTNFSQGEISIFIFLLLSGFIWESPFKNIELTCILCNYKTREELIFSKKKYINVYI